MAAHNLLDAMLFISATCEAFITYTALNNNPASLSIFNIDRYFSQVNWIESPRCSITNISSLLMHKYSTAGIKIMSYIKINLKSKVSSVCD